MKRRLRAYLIALTALFMAGCAAFFSVTGVGKLASGAGTAAILLVAALEVGKLVIASFVHRRWNEIGILQRAGAIFGIIVAMALTSIGIFGQLIGGYAETSAEFQIGNQEIQLKEREKESLKGKIVRFEDQINRKENRADGLSSLRKQQEDRMDSLQNRQAWRSAREAKNLLQETNTEISLLNFDIDSLNNEIGLVIENIAVVDSSIVVMSGELSQGEAAPLKMIADMLGVEMDTATKGFFGFFVLIFDPFAIMLVLFFNVEMTVVRKEEEDLKKIPTPGPATEPEPFLEPGPATEPEPFLEPGPATEPEPALGTNKIVYKETVTGDFIPKADVLKIEEIAEEKKEPVYTDIPEDSHLIVLENINNNVDAIDISSLDETSQMYMRLLGVLYIQGQVIPGGNLYTFSDFTIAVESIGLEMTTEAIKDFLKVCVMLKIINVDKHNRKAIMNYRDAREMISKLKD